MNIIDILLRILDLLELFYQEYQQVRSERILAAQQEVWLDAYTTRMMLRVTERTLYNYVQQGKLVARKRGATNFYLQSSVLALMNG